MVWGDRGLNILTSLYLTLCQFHNYLEVEFLPVHRPSPDEIDSPGEGEGEEKVGEGENGLRGSLEKMALDLTGLWCGRSMHSVYPCRAVCGECASRGITGDRHPYLLLLSGRHATV